MDRSLSWLIVSDIRQPRPTLEMLTLCEKKFNDYLCMARHQRPDDSWVGQIFFCQCAHATTVAKSDGESASELQEHTASELVRNSYRDRAHVTYVDFEEPVIMYPKK